MKKQFLIGLAALAAVGFVACDRPNDKSACSGDGDKEVLYSGILPAADAQGVIYTLKLDFDDDHNYTDGDYRMVENCVASDSIATSGLKVTSVSYTSGDFRKESEVLDGKTVEYIKLLPDAKDGLGAASTSPVYLLINADQSLTMVSQDLVVPENAELYTLSVVK